jgi:sensor histidine kinase YesM
MKIKFNSKILSALIVGAFVAQLIIISYNHFTGYNVHSSILIVLFAWMFGSILSSVGLILLAFIDIKIINLLDRKYDWKQNLPVRIFLEFILVVVVSLIPAVIITVLSNSLFPYKEGLQINIINNSLISAVINVILISILEAYYNYNNYSLANKLAQKLEHENLINQLESLKSQLNPHFLFNSFNVLSSLIMTNPIKAEQFVSELSVIYRYLLSTGEETVVSVEEELSFTVSYLKLQSIRFAEGLNYEIVNMHNINGKLILPVSIQLAVENAIKHNIVDSEFPLYIKIVFNAGNVVITNNYQLRNENTRNGKGLKNLNKRYELLCNTKPKFEIENGIFIAELPYIIED